MEVPSKRVHKVPQEPPVGNPYVMMEQQYAFILQELISLKQQMVILQETWNRILNIKNENVNMQPTWYPWQQQAQVQQPTPLPPEPRAERSIPAWEQEENIDTNNQDTPKKKRSKKVPLILFGLIFVAIVAMIVLFRLGWSCALIPK